MSRFTMNTVALALTLALSGAAAVAGTPPVVGIQVKLDTVHFRKGHTPADIEPIEVFASQHFARMLNLDPEKRKLTWPFSSSVQLDAKTNRLVPDPAAQAKRAVIEVTDKIIALNFIDDDGQYALVRWGSTPPPFSTVKDASIAGTELVDHLFKKFLNADFVKPELEGHEARLKRNLGEVPPGDLENKDGWDVFFDQIRRLPLCTDLRLYPGGKGALPLEFDKYHYIGGYRVMVRCQTDCVSWKATDCPSEPGLRCFTARALREAVEYDNSGQGRDFFALGIEGIPDEVLACLKPGTSLACHCLLIETPLPRTALPDKSYYYDKQCKRKKRPDSPGVMSKLAGGQGKK